MQIEQSTRSFVHNPFFLKKTIIEYKGRDLAESENRKRRNRPCRLSCIDSHYANYNVNLLLTSLFSFHNYFDICGLSCDFLYHLLRRSISASKRKTKSSAAAPTAANILVFFFRLCSFRQKLVSFLSINHVSGAES